MSVTSGKRARRIAIVIIVVAFLVYIIYGSVIIGERIEEKSKEVELLREQVEEQTLINEDLQRSLDQPIDFDYIERIAREQLGLAYPNERVFVNIDGN